MLTKNLILPLAIITTATAAPSALVPELLQSAAVIHDTFWAGQNVCNPAQCRVYKSAADAGHDLTTMLTFSIPQNFAGSTCWLEFYLPSGATTGGGQQVDVFRQWAPVSTCPSQGNNRDVQLGRMVLPSGGGGVARWTDTYSSWMTSPGACPGPGEVFGVEIVGVGDEINTVWTQGPGVGMRMMYT
ncbi:hypothetical protein QBC47DRAFT_400435 [Echria macrotheca]|uniref:Ubiquitin 3 binding protein But2 C-terminal domain-containing protein n=1 Tax=Echria macrotheca TaxID=438768 RepID=A0AAJ0BGG8_9PEZI|nr:hypothetical protein QBC47DRAFT_400435 [Echria macrotheca]